MCVIRTNRLTMAEAEDLIAMLWRTLEDYRIPSPQLKLYQVAGAVELSFEFLSQQDADLVRRVALRLTADALATTAQPMLS